MANMNKGGCGEWPRVADGIHRTPVLFFVMTSFSEKVIILGHPSLSTFLVQNILYYQLAALCTKEGHIDE